jgi:REP element-mobilizing transposase RayT
LKNSETVTHNSVFAANMRHAGGRAIAFRHFSFLGSAGGGSSAPSLDGNKCAFGAKLASPGGAADPPCRLDAHDSHFGRMPYRGFPSRLHHDVSHWVEDGALFHVRVTLDREHEQRLLTEPTLARSLLDSANFYQEKQRWHITLFQLMPDHIHALLSFARDQAISRVIGDWKHFHGHNHAVKWQEGYFDHRLRDDERGEQLLIKMAYIRRNPVVAGLCATVEDWPWIIDPFAGGSSAPSLDDKTNAPSAPN